MYCICSNVKDIDIKRVLTNIVLSSIQLLPLNTFRIIIYFWLLTLKSVLFQVNDKDCKNYKDPLLTLKEKCRLGGRVDPISV